MDWNFLIVFPFVAMELELHCFGIEYFAKDRYTPDPNDSTMAIPCKTRALLFSLSLLPCHSATIFRSLLYFLSPSNEVIINQDPPNPKPSLAFPEPFCEMEMMMVDGMPVGMGLGPLKIHWLPPREPKALSPSPYYFPQLTPIPTLLSPGLWTLLELLRVFTCQSKPKRAQRPSHPSGVSSLNHIIPTHHHHLLHKIRIHSPRMRESGSSFPSHAADWDAMTLSHQKNMETRPRLALTGLKGGGMFWLCVDAVTKAGPLFILAGILLVTAILAATLGHVSRPRRFAMFVGGIIFIIAGKARPSTRETFPRLTLLSLLGIRTFIFTCQFRPLTPPVHTLTQSVERLNRKSPRGLVEGLSLKLTKLSPSLCSIR